MSVVLVVACIGLPWVGLVKVWRLTPAGFAPAVRVSLLDLVQAWSLKRSAARHVARGQVEEALDCWWMAFANNPADIGVLRTWLGTLVRDESLAATRRGRMQGSVEWLLSLGGTNSAKLDLSLGVLERAGDVKQVLAMGTRWKDRLGVEGQGWMARAYFDEGDMARFDLTWQGHAAAFEQDPELALYRDAWRAHWGPVATLREGRARLEAGMGRPELRRLALRLGLHVAHAREDAREYGRLLGVLSAEGAAEASYHVSYWTLLAGNGQKEAARTLAEGGLVEPMTLLDVQGLAKVLVSLGLGPRALSMLEVNRPRFRHHTAFWLVEARCLMELRKWKEMQDLGRAFRGDPSVDPTNIGVGWGIEAVSAHGLGKAEEARDLGRKMLLGVP